jgi:hypothetical protein
MMDSREEMTSKDCDWITIEEVVAHQQLSPVQPVMTAALQDNAPAVAIDKPRSGTRHLDGERPAQGRSGWMRLFGA